MSERTSRYLCYLLRHKPESIGLSLSATGWADINDITRLTTNFTLTAQHILNAVEEDERLVINEDKTKVRALQGHSIGIDLGLAPVNPPEVLYHGTAERFLPSITQKGITKGVRHHVHLTTSLDKAIESGERYGKPIVLEINVSKMQEENKLFYVTDNQVWLTKHVPYNSLKIKALGA